MSLISPAPDCSVRSLSCASNADAEASEKCLKAYDSVCVVLRSEDNPAASEACSALLCGQDLKAICPALVADLQGSRIVGKTLERCDLTGMTFRGVSFERVDFSRCLLFRSTFDDCAFTQCTFDGCVLKRATFSGRCTVVRCSFRLATLTQCQWLHSQRGEALRPSSKLFVGCTFDLCEW